MYFIFMQLLVLLEDTHFIVGLLVWNCTKHYEQEKHLLVLGILSSLFSWQNPILILTTVLRKSGSI